MFDGYSRDALNAIGFSPQASDGRDMFDHPEPPRMPGHRCMFFAHPEWNYVVDKFASDIRATFGTTNIFRIGISPSPARPAHWAKALQQNAGVQSKCAPHCSNAAMLVFNGVDNLEGVHVYALSGDSIWNVEENTPYSVAVSDREVAYKTVFISDDPNFLKKTPHRFAMHRAYPNPFHPTVSISYTIPYRLEKNGWLNMNSYAVRINLFDARGRLVRTLLYKKQKPGHYRVVWDGKGNTGRIAGSGTYFCRLTAGRNSGIRKMVMMK
jgi:hypothetical protein